MYFHKKSKQSNVWKRTSANSQSKRSSLLQEDFDFEQIKSVAKKTSIISRLQLKKSVTLQKSNKQSMHRPSTCIEHNQLSKLKNLKQVAKVYHNQKIKNQKLMKDTYEPGQNVYIEKDDNHHQLARTQISSKYGKSFQKQNNKVGLLGEYSHYQKLTKKQLIQKLISLEYLAQNIFKRNKHLQQQIHKMDASHSNTNNIQTTTLF